MKTQTEKNIEINKGMDMIEINKIQIGSFVKFEGQMWNVISIFLDEIHLKSGSEKKWISINDLNIKP